MAHKFTAEIHILGINPFVFVPPRILDLIFEHAGKSRGPIPVKGTIHKLPYKQTLLRYAGYWRLYINTDMLTDSPKYVGKTITISITFDPEDRSIPLHPKLGVALNKNLKAKSIFNVLPPSLQKEINRYLSGLKTEESLNKNIKRAIDFLLGKEKFIGRPPLQATRQK